MAATQAASTEPVAAQRASRDQIDPALVFLPERREHLLVWSEDRGAGHRLFAKRIGANGLAIGGTDRAEWAATNSRAGAALGDQRWPAVIDGMLIYSERAPGSADYDLYGQRLSGNGRPSGWPWLIYEAPGDQRYPDVVAIERQLGEDYLIVWSEDTRDQGDVMGLRVDYALRRSRGSAFPIALGPGTAEHPTIRRDPVDGRTYLVMYTDDRSGTRDIYGVRLAESGLPRGGPTAGPFAVVASEFDDYAPSLLSTAITIGRRVEDSHLLVWTRDDPVDGPDLMARRLERNGLPKGPAFVLEGGPGAQAWPTAGLRRLPEGAARREADEWLVAWIDDAFGTFDIRGLRVGLLGQRLTTARWLVTD